MSVSGINAVETMFCRPTRYIGSNGKGSVGGTSRPTDVSKDQLGNPKRKV
jgi:hypothetical protein